MGESYPAYTDDLRHDLHGETVGLVHTTPILGCDYCEATIDTMEPVMYEAIRVVNRPGREILLDPPAEWVLDAARCRDCEIEALSPATKGFDEALCILPVSEADGILGVDASTLTVVDLSTHENGYYPPLTEGPTLLQTDDLGHSRWLRLQTQLEDMQTAENAPPAAVETLEDIIRHANDIPPGIDV